MNKTEKFLARLPAARRKAVLLILEQLAAGNESGIDIKALKGHADTYRARIGDYRVIYKRVRGKFALLGIRKRDDQTYRDF